MFRYYLRKLCLCTLVFWLIFILVNYKRSNWDPTPPNTSWEINIQPLTRFDLNNTNHSGTIESVAIVESPSRVASQPVQRFFVLSPKCQMPYLDWFGDDIWKIVKPLKFKSCTDEPSLISVLYNSEEKLYRLHINYDVISSHFPNVTEFGCTYNQIVRGTDDTFSYLMPPNDFGQDWVVPSYFLGVVVQCHTLSNRTHIIQQDAFSFVQQPKHHNDKADAIRAATYPNVFIFGIDSMSRMNFRRMMPLTTEFVSQPGWFEMEGYNKVADNTLPNLIAILTGRNPMRWRRRCDLRTKGCMDSMTFLWNFFHNAGYLTAYAEDMSTFSIFNYMKWGFIRKPVDFYLRPFMIIAENILKTLIQRFVHENPKPLFGLFWTSSFTHDDFRGGHNLDGLFVDYLKEFEEYGLFNNSVVILMSDHGSRFGLLAQHYTGFLEERLPMLHIYLPPWYRERYPSVVEALEVNKNRLCSNYDLHLGIRQLLEQVRPGLTFPEPCVNCKSILRPLPVNRSCEDALIPRHWCTCQPFVQVENSEFVQSLTRMVVYRMNKFLHKLNLEEHCQRLRLNQVLRAEKELHFDDLGNGIAPPHNINTYRLVFSTLPNNGLFRATVHTISQEVEVTVDMESISRLNSYGNESYCAQDAMAKKICFCYKPEVLALKQRYSPKVQKVVYEYLQHHEDDFYDDMEITKTVSGLA
ncbi:uncharacterized protein Dana_GF22679, isoform B [Drosophila ananassae]|uniref:Uncharacterized protein, isoform B n=1 Tax=Drosophila ananassae TaxID=7217 RepID=A0A0P8XHE4_DROAN|nr:uncharacterized protein LOC6505334 isoform X2 [Drosophila ananassae]KPU74217.1 uncharacterized protein Dana_GF22679, isoform B [Drosophila ananassae]